MITEADFLCTNLCSEGERNRGIMTTRNRGIMTISNQIFLNSQTVRGVVEVADPHQRREYAHSTHQCQRYTNHYALLVPARRNPVPTSSDTACTNTKREKTM